MADEAVPHVLPRGPHTLSREVVAASQRRRMIDAMVHVTAGKGYAATTVKDVIARAGVSRQTFYAQFAGKEDCFLQAFREHGEALFARVHDASVAHGDVVESTRAAVATYLHGLAAQPAYARTFLLEVVAAGPRAMMLRDELRERYIGMTLAARRRLPGVPPVSEELVRAAHAGVDALVERRLQRGDPGTVAELEPEALYLLLAVLGVPHAARHAGLC
jgi:AcrR family transcriptional regulator